MEEGIRSSHPLLNPKGPRTQIIGLQGSNTINILVFEHKTPMIWVLGRIQNPKKGKAYYQGS